MPDTLKQTLAQCLANLGWSTDTGTAVASKYYATAVGDKQALAYLQDFDRESTNLLLTGSYWSEGRNALEATMVSIPRDANAEQAKAVAEQFARLADATVAETYAARLLARTD